MRIVKNTLQSGIKNMKRGLKDAQELAINRGLEVLRSGTVPLTPVVSGRLAGSIDGKPKKEGDDIFSVKTKGTKTTGVIGTNVEYAEKVEFGPGKNRLYMTRGFNQNKDDANTAMKNTIKDFLK